MIRWALFFLVFALIAALFGFGGIAGTTAGIAQILFYVGLLLFVVTILYSLLTGKRAPGPGV